MIGISVYLGNDSINKFEPYIQKVQNIGFSSIFTSLHIPEDDPLLYKKRLQELGALASKYEMELMADISPESLEHLGFTWENAEGLLEWGVTGLRVDYGIDEKVIAQMSTKMKIALNASTLTKEGLARLKDAGLRTGAVEAWHNFYPRPETGLDTAEFIDMNRWLRDEGITVMAFIPGDGKRRGPLFEGLPTLEDHRDLSPFAAFLDLKKHGLVDKILVGDIELHEQSLKQFSLFGDGIFLVRAEAAVTDKSLLNTLETIQTNRWDSARDCVRSMESREHGLIGTRPIVAFNTIERMTGSITVDNEKYGRYQGEIQITRRDLSPNPKVNVVGRVIEQDLSLLPYISGGKKFKVEWI